jgi:ribosomal protein S27AE
MRNIKAPLDTLKEIILLYANTKPDPIEKLRVIDEMLSKEEFQHYYHENGYVLKLIMEIGKIGEHKAKEILSDMNQKDELVSRVLNWQADYPPDREDQRKLYDSAYSDIYRYFYTKYCPCNLTKRNVLAEYGFVAAGDDLTRASWIKDRINCLQCNHIHFVAILRSLSADPWRYMEDIIGHYSKESIEEIVHLNNERPLAKIITSYGYRENDEAFPEYLGGLPCNVLVDLLSSEPYAKKKIKECPLCGKFFFAKDSKRKICYEAPCFTEYKRRQKEHQRETDPVTYA